MSINISTIILILGYVLRGLNSLKTQPQTYLGINRIDKGFRKLRKIKGRGIVYHHSVEDFKKIVKDLNDQTQPYENSQHTKTVPSIAYSPQSKFIYTGSIDASFGTWKTDLQPDPSLSNPLFNTMAIMGDTFQSEYIKSQVSRMDVVDVSGKTFVVTNLMGNYIKVYEWNSSAPSVYTLKTPDTLEDFKYKTLGTRDYILISNSPMMISIRERFNLFKYDISSQNLISNIRTNHDIMTLWALNNNRDYFVSVSRSDSASGNYINSEVRLHKTIDMGDIDVLTINKSIYKIVDTDLTFRVQRAGESDSTYKKELLKGQKELLMFYTNGKAEAYRYWEEDVNGDSMLGDIVGRYTMTANGGVSVRKWGNIHGFYSVEAAKTIPGSPHIFTGAGDRRLLLWDYTLNPGNFADGSPKGPTILDTVEIDSNIMDITYVEDKSLIYTSLSLPIFNSAGKVSVIARKVCRIQNCVYCQGPSEVMCYGCRAGFTLTTDGTYCVDCGDPDLKPEYSGYCPNRRTWDIMQQEVISPNLNQVVIDTFGKSLTIKTSGLLFQILVQDDELWREKYKFQNNIHNKFEFSIEDVSPASYNHSFFILQDSIYLALNFSTDFNNKEFKIRNDFENPVLVSEINPKDSLILIGAERTRIISGREQIDEELLRGLGTAGRVAGGIITSVAVITAGLGAFSVCVPFGVGSYILSFFQVIEIISRLSLINVDFGLILTALLEGLEDALGLPEIPEGFFLASDKVNVFPESKGKLTYYEVTPLVGSTIPLFSFLYIAIWTAQYIYVNRLKSKIEVKKQHFSTLTKILNMRFMVYGMAVLEFALFSSHELLHHSFFYNKTIQTEQTSMGRRFLAYFLKDSKISNSEFKFREQTTGTLISYFMAFATFCLAIYETYLIILFMKKVFKAEDIDDFKELGTRSVGADEVLDFYKFHSRGEMNPKKIKRMEKYFTKALKKKKKKDKINKNHKSIIHPSQEKYNKMRRRKKKIRNNLNSLVEINDSGNHDLIQYSEDKQNDFKSLFSKGSNQKNDLPLDQNSNFGSTKRVGTFKTIKTQELEDGINQDQLKIREDDVIDIYQFNNIITENIQEYKIGRQSQEEDGESIVKRKRKELRKRRKKRKIKKKVNPGTPIGNHNDRINSMNASKPSGLNSQNTFNSSLENSSSKSGKSSKNSSKNRSFNSQNDNSRESINSVNESKNFRKRIKKKNSRLPLSPSKQLEDLREKSSNRTNNSLRKKSESRSSNLSRNTFRSSNSSKSKENSSGSLISTTSSALQQQALIKRSLHPLYPFITTGIEPHQVYTLTGISVNFLFLLRLILLSILIVCLQNLPLIQVLMMNFINIAYFVWILRAIFKDKVYDSSCDVAHILVLEIAIQTFLVMCIFFWLDREKSFFDSIGSIIIQMICVFAIAIALIFEMIMIITQVSKGIYDAYKKRRLMKEQIGGLMAELFGRKDPRGLRTGDINHRGVKKMNRRINKLK